MLKRILNDEVKWFGRPRFEYILLGALWIGFICIYVALGALVYHLFGANLDLLLLTAFAGFVVIELALMK